MSQGRSSSKSLFQRLTSNQTLEYWFALPAILVLLALIIFPMLWSVYISFTDLNLSTATSDFAIIGFNNYVSILSSGRFWNSLMNTAYLMGIAVPMQFLLGFATALTMFHYTRGWVTTILFTIFLLPMMMASVITGYIWRLMLQETFGPINYLLGAVGLPEPGWLSAPEVALNSIVFAGIWQWTPFMVLLLYTGRISINEDLYEAARIDGASRWFAFRHVTLPQMKGVIAIAVLLRAMDVFKAFDKMFVMTRGGPGTASELATYYNYLLGFSDFAVGKATAMSWILLIIAVIFASLFLHFLEQGEGGERVR